jgi:hypothetical protein
VEITVSMSYSWLPLAKHRISSRQEGIRRFAKRALDVLDQRLLVGRFEQVQRRLVDVHHHQLPDHLQPHLRMLVEIGAEIGHTCGAQPVHVALDRAEIFLPQRDRHVLEQAAIAFLAEAQGLLGAHLLGDVDAHPQYGRFRQPGGDERNLDGMQDVLPALGIDQRFGRANHAPALLDHLQIVLPVAHPQLPVGLDFAIQAAVRSATSHTIGSRQWPGWPDKKRPARSLTKIRCGTRSMIWRSWAWAS